jgi:hypothetical protein
MIQMQLNATKFGLTTILTYLPATFCSKYNKEKGTLFLRRISFVYVLSSDW